MMCKVCSRNLAHQKDVQGSQRESGVPKKNECKIRRTMQWIEY